MLSLIAFRQPVGRAEIDGQRGSDSAHMSDRPVRLGLITVLPGPAYGTTARFLELFNLQSLDDLPQTLDLQQI